MARIRTIKPIISQSETLAKCSRDARLTFIYLITIADDEGRIKGSSKLIARQIFPLDDDALTNIDTWLNELEAAKCIVRYEVEGQQYLHIPSWSAHQYVPKPTPSKLPPPPDTGAPEQRVERGNSGTSPVALPDHSGSPPVGLRPRARPFVPEKEKEKERGKGGAGGKTRKPVHDAADAADRTGQDGNKNFLDPDPDPNSPPGQTQPPPTSSDPSPSELQAMTDKQLKAEFARSQGAVFKLEILRRQLAAKGDGSEPRGRMKRIGEVTGHA